MAFSVLSIFCARGAVLTETAIYLFHIPHVVVRTAPPRCRCRSHNPKYIPSHLQSWCCRGCANRGVAWRGVAWRGTTLSSNSFNPNAPNNPTQSVTRLLTAPKRAPLPATTVRPPPGRASGACTDREAHTGGLEGHVSRDCTMEQKAKSCYKCGQEGHISRDCPGVGAATEEAA
ncbi:hypothetical protein OF83DRAFT_677308 [Amylostereum chailletii]|nr:hypothetical protein OF83DRAFT_677308 [Amylostereum chailletii]